MSEPCREPLQRLVEWAKRQSTGFVIKYSGDHPIALAEAALATPADTDAAIAALRVDAARYRWLRDEGNPYALIVVGNQLGKGLKVFYDDELDVAIDAALAAPKGEKG